MCLVVGEEKVADGEPRLKHQAFKIYAEEIIWVILITFHSRSHHLP